MTVAVLPENGTSLRPGYSGNGFDEKSRYDSTGSSIYSIYNTQHQKHNSISANSANTLLTQRKSNKHGLSNTRALVSLIKGLVGTGILSMGAGFASAGLWEGLVLTVVIVYLNLYCMDLILEISQYFCLSTGRASLDYADVAEMTFLYGTDWIRKLSSVARFIVNAFQIATQLGFCCAYIAFVTQNIKEFVDIQYPDNTISIYVYVAAFLVPALAIAMVRELKHIAPISLASNFLFLAGFVITFQYLFQDIPSMSERASYKPILELPLFFGIVMFSFEAVGLILPLENQMVEPHVMLGPTGVLKTAGWVTCALYVGIGFFGYLKFGDAAKEKGTITLNLPAEPLYQSVRIILAVAMYFTFALQFYVPVTILRTYLRAKFNNNKRKVFIYEYIGRIGMVLATFCLAAAIPHVDQFVSLIGSFTCSTLALIIPPILDICSRTGPRAKVFSRDLGRFYWRVWVNGFMMLVGVIGLVSGTYSSLKQIIETFMKE